jgi:precorrin-2 dehydrogenase/sirohydrochlorin ferrochelatase
MYPILIDLKQMLILVVGGGRIATRKIQSIVAAGGKPTVIAPKITSELADLFQKKQIVWHQRAFQAGDTAPFQLVFICTNQKSVNQSIAAEIKPHQLLNDTTNQERSNFFNMAYIQNPDYGVAITTYGTNPHKSAEIKASLQDWLPDQPFS